MVQLRCAWNLIQTRRTTTHARIAIEAFGPWDCHDAIYYVATASAKPAFADPAVRFARAGPAALAFATAAHCASWAPLCPAHNETGGKRRSGKTRHGNRWLKGTLTEAAWVAARTKDTYAAAQFRRLATRRGKKRALVAVAHSLLIAAYHVIRDGVPYQDLGPQHFERLNPTRLTRHLVKRVERLGHKVTLESASVAA